MRTLLFDTALARLTVGVADGASVLASVSEELAKGHADRLVPAVAEVMERAGATFPDLEAVGCTVGPGTFTGVRAGVAAARALALAAGLPAAGVTTLQALAALAPADAPATAAIDARRGELYLQHFSAGGVPLGAPVRAPVAEAGREAPDGEPSLVGSGARLVRDVLGRGEVVEGSAAPSAEALARCISERAVPGPGEALRPLYLRPPDATPPERWRRPPGAGG